MPGPPSSMPLGDLPLSRGSLDRAAHRRAEPDLVPKLLADPATRVAVIVAESMELHDEGSLALRPPAPDDRHRLAFFLGEETSEGEQVAYLAVVGDPTDAGHGDWQTLRNAGASLGDRDAGIFTTTQALANWHAAHQFCPRCGAPTEPEQAGWIRRCTRDGSEHYPRTDPAVIMAVVDNDDRLLLGRNAQWPEGRFSVLAGFVEPGESFEAAVAREVEEEVGIAVTDVTYLGNQPWPFPSSDMVGFRAHATTTKLSPDKVEMAEARWFTRDEYLKALRDKEIRTPSGISIAQRLIEHWLGQRIADIEEVSW
ncbi:MAG TPA: NAD(+) diphosphatase [Lapillicoccus sp.]|nr:NAD(+) diphosphatase [Lapillicoccus sp.]